ncbi:MAG: hypothetical protein ACM3SS_00715 [Rhodospirillaceae bacterium]
MKHGAYQSLIFGTLTTEEQSAYQSIDVSPLATLEDAIRLTCIREARMLQRIAALQAAQDGEGMTTVEITDEDGEHASTRKKRRGVLGQIQEIEDALTRVQATKARQVEAYLRALEQFPPKTDEAKARVQEFTTSLDATTAEAWDDEEDAGEEGGDAETPDE